MHNTWLIIRREYIERIRTKAFIIMTLLMPVFMASTILVPVFLGDMKSGGTRHIVLVANDAAIAEAVRQELMPQPAKDAEPSPQNKAGQSSKTEQPRYAIDIDTTVTEAERENLRQQISDGKIDGFIWLSDSDLAARKVVYSAKDVTNFGESIEMRNAVHSAIVKKQLAQKGMSGAEVESVLKPIDFDSIRIEKGKEGASGVAVFLVSFTMVMLLYINVLGVRICCDAVDHRRKVVPHSGSAAVVGDCETVARGKDHWSRRGRPDSGSDLVGNCRCVFYCGHDGIAFHDVERPHPDGWDSCLRRVLHPRLFSVLHDVRGAGRNGEL